MAEPQPRFVESFFDFSFKTFITPKIVAVLYAILLVVGCLMTLGFIICGFSTGAMNGIVALVLSPIVLLFYFVVARVYMELLVVAFKAVEYLRKIADNAE